MPTTTADDVAVSGTDYRYLGMTDTFISENAKQRNASVQLGIDAMGSLAASFTRMNLEGERFGASMSIATGVMTGNMITNMQAVGADDAIALVKMGMNLSNSPSAPVPSNPFGATGGAGSGLNFNLPGKATQITTT